MLLKRLLPPRVSVLNVGSPLRLAVLMEKEERHLFDILINTGNVSRENPDSYFIYP